MENKGVGGPHALNKNHIRGFEGFVSYELNGERY